jgi:TonB family protein
MKSLVVVAVTLSATFSLTLLAQPRYTPASLAGGAPPGLAPMAVGGGQVIVELSINSTGNVDKVRTVRSTPPYTQMVVDAVSGWRFTPATENPTGKDGKPQGQRNVASKVLVAAVYRAPVVQGPTHGEVPANVAAPSADIAFPSSMPEPVFPTLAQNGGVVVVEALLNASGGVSVARVISSAPPFDQPALEAVRQWQFRPPRIGGSTETYAYLIFGFPQPITR